MTAFYIRCDEQNSRLQADSIKIITEETCLKDCYDWARLNLLFMVTSTMSKTSIAKNLHEAQSTGCDCIEHWNDVNNKTKFFVRKK